MNIALKTHIKTPLVEATIDWYQRVLIMKVVKRWNNACDRGAILVLPDGHSQADLEIYYSACAYDFSGLSLQFGVDDLKGFIQRLPEEFNHRPPVKRPWGAWYLYLTDPNGINVIVYEGCL